MADVEVAVEGDEDEAEGGGTVADAQDDRVHSETIRDYGG